MARQFGHTWWGQAWVEALENRAELDPNRLPRGRTYARHDRVARMDLVSGQVTALVRGSRALPYRVVIGVRTFDDDAWARLAGAIAARSGHAAALLDGELDPEILTDAEAVGVRILPGPGDLHPRCSCPDWADPCKHAAAVCYLVADAVDDDPFLLFELRGRPREQLMAEVRAQRHAGSRGSAGGPGGGGARPSASGAESGALVDPGVVARDAWSAEPGPVPARPELAESPGAMAGWSDDPPADAPFTAEGLRALADDASSRAWSQLADGTPSHLGLDEAADLARRAAVALERGEPLSDLARRAGETRSGLGHRAAAWAQAGEAGLAAVDEALWRPPPEVVEQCLEALEDAGVDRSEVQVRSNRITLGEVQLRVTADRRWWRYERRGRSWDLVEPPSRSPADLISGTEL